MRNLKRTSKNSVTQTSPKKILRAGHPRHILVPIDFSKPCIHALGVALELASKFQSKLTLLHVVEPIPQGAHVLFQTLEQDWESPARERLLEFAQAHIPASVSVESIVRLGKPFQEIVHLAQSHEVDLVVLASHGFTGIMHLIMGSTAEQVVRYAACPVFVVRGWEVKEGVHPFKLRDSGGAGCICC
jgi:nucleotide-binding universal stress UspA family protein